MRRVLAVLLMVCTPVVWMAGGYPLLTILLPNYPLTAAASVVGMTMISYYGTYLLTRYVYLPMYHGEPR